MYPVIVSIVNKMDKKNLVQNPRWILSTRENPSPLIPLLLIGVDRMKVNSGSVCLGLLLGVGGFQILTLCKYKRSFVVLLKDRQRVS